VQPQFLAAINHVLQHVIDCVLVYASSFSDNLTHFPPHAADEARCALFGPVSWIIREDPVQITIIDSRPFEVVAFTLPPVVFA
jgi:hypothetical protein